MSVQLFVCMLYNTGMKILIHVLGRLSPLFMLSVFNNCNSCKVMFMYLWSWMKDGLCIFEKYLRTVGF